VVRGGVCLEVPVNEFIARGGELTRQHRLRIDEAVAKKMLKPSVCTSLAWFEVEEIPTGLGEADANSLGGFAFFDRLGGKCLDNVS